MNTTYKATERASSLLTGLIMGAAVSTGITLMITALLAILLDREVISWEKIGYAILIMIMLSAFMGGVTAYNRIRRQRVLISLMAGLIYWGVLLSVTALFFGGQYEAVGVTALLVAGGSLCSAMVGIGKGGGEAGRRKRKRYR